MPKRVLIAAKHSGLIHCQHHLRMSEAEIRASLKAQRRSDRMLQSHEKQQETLQKLRDYFPDADWVSPDGLTPDLFTSELYCVIAAGGDEFLKLTAGYNRTSLPMIGVTLDSNLSRGALHAYSDKTLERLVADIENNRVQFREWPRIRVEVENPKSERRSGFALSEVTFGETEKDLTSRNVHSFQGREESHGGSVLLVYNGAGSTGWARSIGRSRRSMTDGPEYALSAYSPEEKLLRWAVESPSSGSNNSSLERGELRIGEELRIVSQNDGNGVISFDPGTNNRIPFPPGTAATVSIHEELPFIVAMRPEE